MVAEIKERQGDLSLRQGDSTAHVRMDAMIDHYFSLLKDTLSTRNKGNEREKKINARKRKIESEN